mmetsp:Transcript_53738/g.92436  ORF Transcript_53738/g.92436 Transcript_53738/m.92436 type:complete len:322 (-) Transcript_53738:200-1165(-)
MRVPALGRVARGAKTNICRSCDLLERTCLGAFAVNGEGLPLQGLDDEVGHHAAVVGVHARAERVEDARHAHLHLLLRLVRVHHCLRHALAFVVARAWADGVHVAPVRLGLRVHFGVPVDLRGRGEQDARLDALGEAQHVQGALRRRLDGLDRVVLVVRRGGGAGEVVDLVDLDEDGVHHVPDNHLKRGVADPVLHVFLAPREHVVQHDDLVALHHEAVHEVGPHEAGAPSDEDTLSVPFRERRDWGPQLATFGRLVLNRRHLFEKLRSHLAGDGLVQVRSSTTPTPSISIFHFAAKTNSSIKHKDYGQGEQAEKALKVQTE